MRIDIIGGSGFIGTRLARRLNSRADVQFSIVDKAQSATFPYRVLIADVRNLDELRHVIADKAVIINLAAEHRDDVSPRSLYFDVNVEGARNICIVAREKNCRTIIFISSVAVYGFAPIGTDESGAIAPFNDYGRTKHQAEEVFGNWFKEAPEERTLVIIRPTVVFGEQNRGNVYNLLRQIASGRFIMVGDGENIKSIAYVENVAAFIEHTIKYKAGFYLYNFTDKPDFTMNELVSLVNKMLGRPETIAIRFPYRLGFMMAKIVDVAAALTGRRFPISSIRVRKFCSNSVYKAAVPQSGFTSPISLTEALKKTIQYEFIENHPEVHLFYTE